MGKCITYVGLDVHKNSIAVAFADEGRDGDLRSYGTISGDLLSLDKVVRKLVSRGTEPRFVYEAGPCGYGIYRHLILSCVQVHTNNPRESREAFHGCGIAL